MRSLLSFFTVLPARGATLEEAARQTYLLPLVGLFTAVPGVAVLLLLGPVLPPGVTATLALGAVLVAAGLHHADGVLDVGDALMVRGTAERRRAVLKDTRVGIGGIGTLFLVYAPTLAALGALAADSPARAALALLAGEVSARAAMLLILALGEPAEPASSSVPFVRAMRGPSRTPGLALSLVAPLPFLLPLGPPALLVVLAAPVVALVSLRVANAAFDGINGDASGAAGEASRAVALVVISATV